MKIKSFLGGFDKNFCYLMWCEKTNLTAIIDPSVSVNPILEYIQYNNLILDKILVTHTHHDHIAYLDDILNEYPNIKVFVHTNSCTLKNYNIHPLTHGELLSLGTEMFVSLFTPGHYYDSICYYNKARALIFTGDTIFVGRTGRVISSKSNIKELFHSIYNVILKLPSKTIIYPGHHYGYKKYITIKENISISDFFNCNTLNEFKKVMKNFEKNRKKL